MDLFPAIDILGGKAVRLVRGDFDQRREYDDDPLSAARRWVEAGASHLHVVDLDGARSGEPQNLEQLRRISTALGDEVELIQYGGGLRSRPAAEAALEAGAGRVVLGTAAFLASGLPGKLLGELLGAHSERVAVGVDVRGGQVAVDGWRQKTSMRAVEAIETVVAAGVRTVVYTNVDRDGTLEGIHPTSLGDVSQATGGGGCLIYSGGIGSIEDLRILASLDLANLGGVIVGKALYEGRFGVAEALAALEQRPPTAGTAEAS